jgi:hypothetical protein
MIRTQRKARRLRRFVVENLEQRLAMASDFSSAFGLGVSGTGNDLRSNAIAEDSAGNIVIVGSIKGTVDMDPGSGVSNLTNSGNRDSYIAKYSSTGSLIWAETFSGSASNSVGQGSAVKIDAAGNIYAAGSFSGGVNFNPGGTATTLSAPGRTDAYVVKLDANGGLVWAKSTTGTSTSVDQIYALCLDGQGGVNVAGAFQDSIQLGSTTLTATGAGEAFVAHLDSTGNFAWAMSSAGSGTSTAEIRSMATDSNGRVVMAGFYAGSVTFGSGLNASTLSSSSGTRDALIWVVDNAGTTAWTKGYGSNDFDQATAITVDNSNNIYVAGAFSGTVAFSTGVFPQQITSTGLYDSFVIKLTPSGGLGWVAAFNGTSGAQQPGGIGIDTASHVVVAGWFEGTVDFNPGPTTGLLTSAGAQDVYLATLDSFGNFVTAKRAGGANSDLAYGLAVNSAGTLAVTGDYTGPASFGTTSVPSVGTKSIFVATVAASTTPPPQPLAPVLQAASDSGASASDLITSVTSPTFDMSATDTGLTVQLLRDGTIVGTRTGSGPITDTGPVPEGIHTYEAVQVNGSGISGAFSSGRIVTIITTPPSTPAAPGINSADDSGVASDGITNVTQPRLEGVTTPNMTILLLNSFGTTIASAMTSSSGNYSIALPTSLANGTYLYRVKALDLAGNRSAPSATLSLVIDTTAPLAPSVLRLMSADDSGTAGDDITNVNTARFTGTAEAGATVRLVLANGTVVGTAQVGLNGTFTVRSTTPFADGTFTLAASVMDVAGNIGTVGPSTSVTIKTTQPSAPSAPGLLANEDSGVQGDGITNVNKPHLMGTATAGISVQLLSATGLVLGTATTSQAGVYSLIPTQALPEGPNTLSVVAVDVAGNTSPASASASFTILTSLPAAPSKPALLSTDDSATQGDGITNVALPHIVGTAPANTIVRLLSGVATIGTATVGANGTYSIVPTSSFTDGSYTLTAVATDLAGNIGNASGAFSLTILTTAPTAITNFVLMTVDDSGVLGDNITNVNAPRFSGKAQAQSTVQLIGPNGVLGTVVAGSSGFFAVKPSSPLPDGPIDLLVRSIDAAGNVGPNTANLHILINSKAPNAPSAPALLAIDDTGAFGDRVTKINKPRLIGTATAGLTVRLLDASANVLGTSLVLGDGTYQITPSGALPDGVNVLTVVAIDSAANTSVASASLSLTIMTTPPSAPSALTLLSADDSGVAGDAITNVLQPRFTGTAAGFSAISLINASGTTIGQATVSADGKFQLKPSAALPQGVSVLHARISDPAGNLSPDGPNFTITIATNLPSSPTLTLLAADDSGLAGDNITNVTQPRFNGQTTSATTVFLIDAGGNVLGQTTASSDGSFQVKPAISLAQGNVVLHVKATDVAGNSSLDSSAVSLSIRTTAPAAPTISLLAADDTGTVGDGSTTVVQPRLVGTTVAGQNVALLNASNVTLGQIASGSDGKFQIKPTTAFAAGTYVLHTKVTDLAGNVSTDGPAFTLTIQNAVVPTPTLTLLAADDLGVKGDSSTTLRNPRLTGTGQVGTTIQLIDGASKVVATTTVGTNGTFVLNAPAAFVGTYIFTAKAIDSNGIASKPSTNVSFKVASVYGDFDGDGKADLVTYSPSTAKWTTRASSTGAITLVNFGQSNVDVPVASDYEGTGKSDLAVFRPTTAQWIIFNPAANTVRTVAFGKAGDIPIPGDYDGVGKSELAVYRPSTGQWLVLNPTTNQTRTVNFGGANVDQPVPADYDGVGKLQMAVYRPTTATWIVFRSNGTVTQQNFGTTKLDMPIPADFDGDGKADFATFRRSTDIWSYQQTSNNAIVSIQQGTPGSDLPAPLNYSGTGKASIATYRPATAAFTVRSVVDSSLATTVVGKAGSDVPANLPISVRLSGVKLLPVTQNSVTTPGIKPSLKIVTGNLTKSPSPLATPAAQRNRVASTAHHSNQAEQTWDDALAGLSGGSPKG